MVPPYSHRVSRVRRYSGFGSLFDLFAYGTLTLCGWPSHTILLKSQILNAVHTPEILLLLVWPLPRSLATTYGISVDFFSSPYLDVSVQAVPYAHLCIQCTLTGYYSSRVAPFGNLRVKCLLTTNRSISLLAASFVGS